MRGLGLLFLGISCLMHFLARPIVAKKKCRTFTFPSLTPELTITAADHSTISIPVTLDNFEYPECENETVYIYVWQEKANEGSPQRDVCIARLTNADCVFNLSHGCHCIDGINGIVFDKTVTRADSGTWVWRTGDGTSRTNITFQVTYPPRVTELRINTSATSDVHPSLVSAAQNTTLQVTCKWEKGHPDGIDPSKVQLLNVQGVPLHIVERNDTWVRTEVLARCEDAGNITCVVPGASENSTAELIILNCQDTSHEGFSTDASVTVWLIQNNEADANFLESWVFTPIIVVVLNVFTVIMIVITVTICVWKRKGTKKTRRNPRGPLPPLPHDAIPSSEKRRVCPI